MKADSNRTAPINVIAAAAYLAPRNAGGPTLQSVTPSPAIRMPQNAKLTVWTTPWEPSASSLMVLRTGL